MNTETLLDNVVTPEVAAPVSNPVVETVATEPVAETVTVVNATEPKKRGRKPNPNLTKKVFLNLDGSTRGRGKPKKGTAYRVVTIQKSLSWPAPVLAEETVTV